MGQLADRIAHLLREHGFDPAARQADIQALAHLEESDNALAQTRFHELKSHIFREARALLISSLKTKPFVRDLPPLDTTGYSTREIESELRQLEKAAPHAAAIAAAQQEEAKLRGAIRFRAIPPEATLPSAHWTELAPLVDLAESSRRILAREARIEQRARDASRRGAKLGVIVPPPATATDEALDQVEAALRQAETLEDAHAAAVAPLRDPAVATWRGDSRKRFVREADALHKRGDTEGLHELAARAEELRREAAKASEDAARARRAGRAPPPKERKSTDAMDPYG